MRVLRSAGANDASPTVSLDLLCKPFVEAGGELAVNSAPDIGCVPLQPQRVQAAYEEYVCPAFVERTEDLQPDASNAVCGRLRMLTCSPPLHATSLG